MPAYSNSPFNLPVTVLVPGQTGFSWGGYNDLVSPSKMRITNVALATNVATLTVQVIDGPNPAVGSLISVQGTQNTSGLFNVSGIALTGVTLSASGAGTVTFALTHADVTSAADSGLAIVATPPTYETFTAAATAGKQFYIPRSSFGSGVRNLSWFTQILGGPSPAAANLQIADEDIDAEYSTVDTSSSTTGETRELSKVPLNMVAGKFVRISGSRTGGTLPTWRAGIVLS